MSFDINQPVIDPESGEYIEEAGLAYQDMILKLFAASPEGVAYSRHQGP